MFKTKKEAIAYLGADLSRPGKMPCKGWSLPAMKTCRTGRQSLRLKDSICSSCYACKGNYVFAHVKDALARRLEATKKPHFEKAMVKLITGMPYFRWHDSGDLYSIEYLQRIINIARATPDTRHWLPTRELDLVDRYAFRFPIPSNLTIRISGLQVDKFITPDAFVVSNVTTKVYPTDPLDGITSYCPSTWNPLSVGSCGTCRACWDSNIDSIVYKKH